MSIQIYRVDDLARQRAVRAAQIAALPPQLARHVSNQWDFDRKPWVHPRTPRFISFAQGEASPELQRLRSDITLQNNLRVQYPDWNWDQLMISPELPNEIAAGVRLSAAAYNPAAIDQEVLALYRPAGYTLSSTVPLLAEYYLLTDLNRPTRGPSLSAPCIIRSIYINCQLDDHSSLLILTFAVPPMGLIASISEIPVYQESGKLTVNIRPDYWMLSGSVNPEIDFQAAQGFTLSSSQQVRLRAISFYITVEPLIRQY